MLNLLWLIIMPRRYRGLTSSFKTDVDIFGGAWICIIWGWRLSCEEGKENGIIGTKFTQVEFIITWANL